MKKSDAVKFFGSIELTAHAMNVSGRAVDKWRGTLSPQLADRVVGAALRIRGIGVTRAAFPKWFQTPER